MSRGSLREQKKAATRALLGRAALMLASERGLEAINGDAIAAAAGVAPRTFRNYFASKEDAVLFTLQTVQDRYVGTFEACDPAEPVPDSLEKAAIALVDDREVFELLVAAHRLVVRNPALFARRAASRSAATSALVHMVAERMGSDAQRDLDPWLVCRCAEAVLQSALEAYFADPSRQRAITGLVREGFSRLRHGIASPVP